MKLQSILSTTRQRRNAKGDVGGSKIFETSISLAEKTCDSNDPAGPLGGKKFSLDIPCIEEGANTGRSYGAEPGPDDKMLKLESARN